MTGKFRSFTLILISIVIGCTLALILLEIMFRVSGYSPEKKEVLNIELLPDTSLFINDTLLGFKMNAGKYRLTYENGYEWSFSNNNNGYRQSRTEDHIPYELKFKNCWILGCSYTFGWSVNDEENFAYLLQKAKSDWMIENLGQPAYSTLQSFLQLKRELNRNTPPDIVILVYASFHDERNIGSVNWIRQLAPYNELGDLSIPYVKSYDEDSLRIRYKDVIYVSSWLANHSAAFTYIRSNIKAKAEFYKGTKVTARLIEHIHVLCQKYEIDFKVAIINSNKTTADLYSILKINNIETFDFTIDSRKEGYTNEPFDSHPSAKAHQEISKDLIRLFELGSN
ncbi:MAG: hypothetical protein HKN22_02190 [Bacteroidia bacterium]|nr:hypothetical protein [Bacteroidia bacterium]